MDMEMKLIYESIYAYLKDKFGIDVVDYTFKRDYIINPLKKGKGCPNNIKYKPEYPYKEDLEYLYLTLNIDRKSLLLLFNCGCSTFKRWCKALDIHKDVELLEINAKKSVLEKYGVKSFSQTDEYKKLWKIYREEYKEKTYIGMKNNNSFAKSISKEEKIIYEKLKDIYPNVVSQYKSKEYPFKCDFYIPEIDTYIEYQGYWKHGISHFLYNGINYNCHCPYDENNDIHKKVVEYWKSKNSKEYNDAIERWTIKDVQKRQVAKNNNLNYVEWFSINEFNEWFNKEHHA